MSSNRNSKHSWSAAWTIAIAVHLALFAGLAVFLKPDNLVHVVKMTPQPNETVNILATQAVRPTLYFSEKGVKLESVRLCLVPTDESAPKPCYSAQRHAEVAEAVVFEPVREAGHYEIVVDEDAFDAPYALDGEFVQKLPSGNQAPGGAFRAGFEVKIRSEELLTASVFDVTKPLVNEEAAATQPVEPQQQPKPVMEPKPPTPKRPKKTKPPPAEVVAPEVAAPEATEATVDPEPQKIKLSPEMLQISPMTMAPSLLNESAQVAQAVFDSKDRSDVVEAANLAKKQFDAAFSGNGPKVGVGERGNAVNHDKDVAEYLALMHKEIHPRWADGYLIRLDTIYRGHDQRLQNSNLETILEITLDSLGKVSEVIIVASSGVTDFDSEAISVAWRSSPKLPPPKQMLSKDSKAYIHWTFWRDTRQCGVFGVKVFRLDRSTKDAIEFDLKKVQLMEKKLGLKPSTLQGYKSLPVPNKASGAAENREQSDPPVFEKINPLDD